MASRRGNPFSRIPSKAAQRKAEVKEAAEEGRARQGDDARVFTHQGPGTGNAGAADPPASSAILNAQAPATAAPVIQARSASVEAAAEGVRARIADDEFKLGARGAGEAGPKTEPSTPGQQSNDSGVNTSGNVSAGGISGRRAAPGTDSATVELDESVQAALGQLAGSRTGLRGPADVFEAAAGAGPSPSDASGGGTARSGTPGELFGGTGPGDGAAEHAAEVAGQVPSGGGSLLGSRLGGTSADLGIAAGLIGDRAATASSPGVADGANAAALPFPLNVVPAIVDAASDVNVAIDDAFIEARTRVGRGLDGGLSGHVDRALVDFEDAGGGRAGIEAAINKGIDRALGPAVVPVTEEGPIPPFDPGAAGSGVKDPGDPDAVGGRPTEAQVAFRQALKDSLGVRSPGSGDIDPADDSASAAGATGSLGLGDVANNNESLVGRPTGPGGETGGTGHTPVGGTDVDPLEGSAFSGPALGGTPEALQFGSTVLGLDAARRATAADDDEEDDEDE